MTERDDLLRTIITYPEDDAPRLVYADWLEEQGEAERAEFIRVQIELAKYLATGSQIKTANGMEFIRPGWEALRRREQELLDGPATQVGIDTTAFWPIEFRRGFVESITCTWADWDAHHAEIMRVTPLREATLTTYPDIGMGYHHIIWSVLSMRWPTIKFRLPPTTWPEGESWDVRYGHRFRRATLSAIRPG